MFRKGLSVVPCTYLTEYVAKLFLSENSKSLFVQFSKERNSTFSSGLSSICSSKVSLSIGAQTNQPNTQLTQPTFRLEPDQLGHELALFNLQQKPIILCFPVLLLAFCKLAPHICHLLTTSPPATYSRSRYMASLASGGQKFLVSNWANQLSPVSPNSRSSSTPGF